MVGNMTSSLFHYLLALSIAFAPMLPAFASGKMSASSHAAHASHANHTDTHVGIEGGGNRTAPLPVKHEHCNGQCCLACSMSFVETDVIWHGAAQARSIQVPVVVRLIQHHTVTVPHRPPRTLS